MPVHSNVLSNPTMPHGALTHAEILQQPELWPTTLAIVRKSAWANAEFDRPTIVTGAGTSAYAARAIAASWPNAHDVATTDLLIESPAEIERRVPGFSASGLLISIGRSGDSPESVAVVRQMKQKCPDVEHLALTCNAEGKLAKMPGVQPIVLDPRTNDRSLAMTSSFSNLVLAGLCLRNREELASLLPSCCNNVQRNLPEIEARAQQLSSRSVERVVVLASGPLQALAVETSLKILEMTAGRTVTLPETFLGLRHGPMSFLRDNTLVLCFLSSSPARRRYEEDLLRELRRKGLGRVVGIAPQGADADLFDDAIPASAGDVRDELRVPFEIPFSQLLAYHLSLKEGLDPDSPSPSGAITRVVPTFTVYDE